MGVKENKLVALYFLDILSAYYPGAQIELNYAENDPWQLLVAVLLSAQATDVRVNLVTPKLFEAFPDLSSFARAQPEDVQRYIRSIGVFRNKAKNIVLAAQQIIAQHGGVVPRERHLLESLAGIGPKSAAVIIANIYQVPAIAVDTHVGRIARRLGLTGHSDPSQVEKELTALLPENRLLEAHHVLIWHGRRICFARKPACSQCPVAPRCPKIGVLKSA